MTIKKLKIYLCGNFESKNIQLIVKKFVENKFNKIITCQNDNYVINMLKICNKIKEDPDNNIAILFSNSGRNLKFLSSNFETIKMNIVNKTNKSRVTTFLNTNVLCFAINEFNEEEILKIIKTYFNYLDRKQLFY